MMRNELPTGTERSGAAETLRDSIPGAQGLAASEAAAAARADAKIANWRAYLPEDCVKAMVRDGWHFTT